MDFVNQVIQGDCLEVMKSIPDSSVDMILCDLPYGVTANNKWDVVIPFKPLWEQYRRVTKENAAIVLTATQPFTSQLIMSNPKMFRYDLVWEKNKKTGFLNANKMPLRAHESILVFYRSVPVYNPQKSKGHNPVNSYTKHTGDGSNYGKTKTGIKGGGQTDRFPTSIIKIPVVNNDSEDKHHPTQKPVALFEYLIKTFSNENDVILDSCMGSGTMCIAALRTNRKFIGIDSDLGFCEIAKQRIHKHTLVESIS